MGCTNVWVFFVVWIIWDGPALELEGRPLQRALPSDTAQGLHTHMSLHNKSRGVITLQYTSVTRS